MPDKRFRWIFFDLDGTLINSLGVLYRTYKRFLSAHDLHGDPKEFDSLKGLLIDEVVGKLKRKYRLSDPVNKLTSFYLKNLRLTYWREAQQVPNAGATLWRLNKTGFRLALVTSARAALARPLIKKMGWEKHFECMTFGDEAEKGKPDPEIYRLAMKKARLEAKESFLVLEDSVYGVRAAKKAGAKVIALSTNSNRSRLVFAGADHVIPNLSVLPDTIALLEKQKGSRVVFQGADIRVALNQGTPRKKRPGFLFCVGRFRKNRSRLDLTGRLVRYETFVQKSALAKKRQPALAVSGITVLRKNGRSDRFLVGQRSPFVHHYKRHWEFAPAGGLGAESVNTGGGIDYKKQLLQELAEETGIPAHRVSRVRPFALIWDPIAHVFDIFCEITLSNRFQATDLSFNREYSRMKWMTLPVIHRMLRNKKRVVPIMELAMRTWASSNDKKGKV